MSARPSAILDAAEELFAERGYAGATLRDVATRVGVRPPSLYNHFPSKDALYAAVLERGIGPVIELLARSAAAPAEDASAPGRLVTEVMRILARRPGLPRLVLHETLAGGAAADADPAQLDRARLRARTRARVGEPGGVALDPEQIPLLVIALYNVVVGYFTIASLYRDLSGAELLADPALEAQTRFLRELMGRCSARDPIPEPAEEIAVGHRRRVPADPENWDAQMTERLRWLREHEPVHWSAKDDLFLVTKYEDVAFISKHQELFTSEHGVRPSNPAKIGLIDEAEPRHGQLRSLINAGFTPRMVRKLESAFREIVDRIDRRRRGARRLRLRQGDRRAASAHADRAR